MPFNNINSVSITETFNLQVLSNNRTGRIVEFAGIFVDQFTDCVPPVKKNKGPHYSF